MQMMEQLLNLPVPPTAVFAASDELAIGAIQAAYRRNLALPDDLAVIGYDDIELAPFFGLSTMRQPMTEMGRQGVNLLLHQLTQREPASVQCILPVELVVRATTVS
jgi:DNA-binding LacI/PurR family transcriptional regulator